MKNIVDGKTDVIQVYVRVADREVRAYGQGRD